MSSLTGLLAGSARNTLKAGVESTQVTPLHTIVELDNKTGYLLLTRGGPMQAFTTIKELADWLVADAVQHRLRGPTAASSHEGAQMSVTGSPL